VSHYTDATTLDSVVIVGRSAVIADYTDAINLGIGVIVCRIGAIVFYIDVVDSRIAASFLCGDVRHQRRFLLAGRFNASPTLATL
jgi:hypothetical protein